MNVRELWDWASDRETKRRLSGWLSLIGLGLSIAVVALATYAPPRSAIGIYLTGYAEPVELPPRISRPTSSTLEFSSQGSFLFSTFAMLFLAGGIGWLAHGYLADDEDLE